MFIYVDKALVSKIGVVKIDGKNIEAKPKGSKLLDKENDYPVILYKRLDNSFDSSRVDNEQQVVSWNGVDSNLPPDNFLIFEPSIPYTLTYQVEVIARDEFSLDSMVLHVDKMIKPNGDFIKFIGKDVDSGNTKEFKFKILLKQKKRVEDYDEELFRYVYTYDVLISIDHDNKVLEMSYI